MRNNIFSCAILSLTVVLFAACVAKAQPTGEELAELQKIPEFGYIVYGVGDKSRDDFAAYGIWKIKLRETEPVKLSATGRVPVIHPENGNLIAYSEPVSPGATSYNIVLMDAGGNDKRAITKTPLPYVQFLSWTDRNTIVFTSSESVASPYKFPHKIWVTDTLGNVTEIPHNYSVGSSGGKGIDGVFMCRDKVLFRYNFDVYLCSVDQDNPSEGITQVARQGNRCGHTISPDYTLCIMNLLSHTGFGVYSMDDLAHQRTLPVVRGGWSNDWAWSNLMEWGCFTTEQEECEIYVQNVTTGKFVRQTWTGDKVAEHNPDMWVGEIVSTRVASPSISPYKPDFIGSLDIAITCATPGAKIYYTIDGSEPSEQSAQYAGPLTIKTSTTIKARAYAAELDPSAVATRTYLPMKIRTPDNPARIVKGLDYRYYEGEWKTLPDFTTLTPSATGSVDSVTLAPKKRNDNFAMLFTGYISIHENVLFTFYLRSDDGAKLFIGDSCLIDNDGLHAPSEKSAEIALGTGLHAFTVAYFEATNAEICEVSFEADDLSKRIIPASVFFRPDPEAQTSISLSKPSGGHFAIGDTLAIAWEYEIGRKAVVELSLNDGLTYDHILTTAGIIHQLKAESLLWPIPNDNSYLCDKARIRVRDYDMIDVFAVSQPFAIVDTKLAARTTVAGQTIPGISFHTNILRAPGRSSKNPSLALFDMHGRAIPLPGKMTMSAGQWDLSQLPVGAYVATVRDGQALYSKKVAVTR